MVAAARWEKGGEQVGSEIDRQRTAIAQMQGKVTDLCGAPLLPGQLLLQVLLALTRRRRLGLPLQRNRFAPRHPLLHHSKLLPRCCHFAHCLVRP